MDVQAIKEIERLATAATELKVVGIRGDSRRKFVLNPVDGQLKELIVEPKFWRSHTFFRIADFAAAVLAWDDQGGAAKVHAIYLDDGHAVAVLDPWVQEQFQMPLKLSHAAMSLPLMPAGEAYEQEQLVLKLRTQWKGVFDDTLLAAIKSLRWSTLDEASESIEPNAQHSLGRAVERKAIGADKLPDTVLARFHWLVPEMFPADTSVVVAAVPFALTLDFRARKIGLAPDASAMSAARLAAWSQVESCLNGHLNGHVPVYLAKLAAEPVDEE